LPRFTCEFDSRYPLQLHITSTVEVILMRILAFGINHDSSVCSIHDGKLEFFCKEERLTRIKRDHSPFNSLKKFDDLKLGKVDHVLYTTPSNNNTSIEKEYQEYVKETFGVEMENYSHIRHHLCHASLAFYNSGYEQCLVFVIDRNGSLFFMNDTEVCREAESVFVCTNVNNIFPLHKSFWINELSEHNRYAIKQYMKDVYPHTYVQCENSLSIVKAYEAATTLIGQHPLENGKTMGLASYGSNLEYEPLFVNGSPIRNHFSPIMTDDKFGHVSFVDHEDKIQKDFSDGDHQYLADKAKHVQIETQKEVLRLIKKYVDQTGIKNVCVVGGYGLNIVANNYYIENLPDVNFYFEPVADDTGISIGAAMLKYAEVMQRKPEPVADNFYHYYDDSEVLNVGEDATVEIVCDLLIAGKSVAIFDGAPEAGPRALGHRSILFDARIKNGKDIVNKIKKREWYRPFAGIVLQDKFKEFFHTNGLKESPYMTINFACKDGLKEFVPSIVHVDNTCRIQTVNKGFIFDLLEVFNRKTNCPMLLNTSFNLAGEPLIQTKKEAIEMLDKSMLDAVYFVQEKKLVTRR
jgi:carbamoyltransferase